MIKTNDKLNQTVKETLKMRGDNMSLYAVKRIEELEEKLKQQIEEWQTKWEVFQELIDDRIKVQDFSGAYRSQCQSGTLKRCIEDVCDIIKTRKIGIIGSDKRNKSVALKLIKELQSKKDTDIEKCKCGKGKVTFTCIGEDLFAAEMENATVKTDESDHVYYCMCGHLITTADKLLTKNFN